MSYTNAEQVRHHLVIPYPVQDQIVDQPVTLAGSDYVRFYGGGVEAATLLVKSIQSVTPSRTDVTFIGGTVSIIAGPIVPGSVIVASDSSLGTLFQENLDYIVDFKTGSLTVKAGGALSANQAVTVWYLAYTLYAEGTDFSLSADRGELKRLSGGTIAPGETVYLDYQPRYVSVADEIVDNAVAMANAMVENDVDPDRQFEVDATLTAAATYRALEIVCRASASRELASGRAGDRIAAIWIKLAEGYSDRSEKLLRDFRPPYSGPNNPARS